MAKAISQVTELHAAVKRGDLAAIKALLEKNRALANARSETDPRGTFPLHVAAEFGQAAAAKLLLDYGADVSARELENDAIALGCAVGGTQGRWQQFSDATIDDWRETAEIIRARGGVE